MIAKLKGKIDELKPSELILYINGVGYHLYIPFSTYEKIKDLKETLIYVYTYHKEDQFKLFGFYSEKEKNLFSLLLNISGVGPSMALSILSTMNPDQLLEAVRSNNSAILTKIPGVGKNKSEKLIFELKRKIKKLEYNNFTPSPNALHRSEAIEALVSLGFHESISSKTVDNILHENPDETLENLVKSALKDLSL